MYSTHPSLRTKTFGAGLGSDEKKRFEVIVEEGCS
eukprot:COSAG02_NODE_1118_length_14469_cov_8.856228_16_plen_35_part_00